MSILNPNKLGLSLGITGSIFYLGCAILMNILNHEGTVRLFNSLLHGLDVSSIVTMDVPLVNSVIGLVCTSSLSYLAGFLIAVIYNKLDH